MKKTKKRKVGRPKKIESPEQFWAHFLDYKIEVKTNPILVHDFVGKDGGAAHREKERPLTIEGFENYLDEEYDISGGIQQYLENRDERYGEFVSIVARMRRAIRQDQIEGGMVGIYHPNLTARIQGIKDRVDDEGTKDIKILNIDPLDVDNND